MYDNRKIISLIPARGGSKGIKHKNIVELHGKPLIAYTILSSKNSKYIDKTIVSTDDRKIAEISKRYGAEVPFMRPSELASDSSSTIDVVLHAINYLRATKEVFDVLTLLQPTQPLRTENDVDKAIEEFFKKGEKGLVSISPVEDHPILIRKMNDNGMLSPILNISSTCRRQDMPRYYKVNGCIYINRLDEIDLKTSFNDNPIGYFMDISHSVDIDEPKDLIMAEYFLAMEGGANGL